MWGGEGGDDGFGKDWGLAEGGRAEGKKRQRGERFCGCLGGRGFGGLVGSQVKGGMGMWGSGIVLPHSPVMC